MFEKFPKRLAVAAVLLVSGGVYIKALENGFVIDDRYLVLENPWIRDLGYIPVIFSSSMWSFLSEAPHNFYRPVMQLVYMLDYHLFGPEPWAFHLTKILFHMGASILVFLTASFVISHLRGEGGADPATDADAKTRDTYIACIAALLFASHPVNTDAVLNGITEVMFAFFSLLSFLLYMKGRTEVKTGAIWASAFFFFLAALSKETALTLPLLLLAFDYSFEGFAGGLGVWVRRMLPRYAPFVLAAALYSALRISALGSPLPTGLHKGLSAYEYVLNVFPLFAQYIEKLLLPINLNAAYVFRPVTSVFDPAAVKGLLVTAAFFGAVYFFRRRSRVVFIGLMLVLIPLIPALYIPALGVHVFADRYMYLPSAGFVILVSMGLAALDRALKARRAPAYIMLSAAIIITALYSAGTIKRTPVWKDGVSLWSDTVAKDPDTDTHRLSLGVAYYAAGRTDEAIAEYKKALELKPGYYKALVNLGIIYDNLGQTEEAERMLLKGLAHNPGSANPHYNVGVFYLNHGRAEQAIVELRKALELRPYYLKGQLSLARAYSALGRYEEAVREYSKALKLNPHDASAHVFLADAYFNNGLTDEAGAEYREALSLAPGLVDARFGFALVHHTKGRMAEAVEEYRSVLTIDPAHLRARSNLGAALERLGKTSEAAQEYRRVIRLQPDYTDARFNLALLYKKKGLTKEARRELEELLKIDPDHRRALKALGALP